MNLGELRTLAADTLDGLNPDWTVHPGPVDAVQPPAFMLVWADRAEPWLTPATWCQSYAQLDVIVVAGRLEPESNFATLEAMVAEGWVALTAAGVTVAATTAPAGFEVGQITYLASRILVRQTVDIPGGT